MAKVKLSSVSLALLITTALGGCAHPVAALSSHTIQVAPNQEADVLWMIKDGQLVRCTGEGGKPACVTVD
jgi:hypothetical protein